MNPSNQSEDIFKYYNHLGFFNPYYYRNKGGKLVIENSFREIMNLYPEKPELDITAIIEILNKNFILGDRTLIKGINRTPWMAKPDEDHKDWIYENVPDHTEIDLDEKTIAHNLFELVCEELLEYIGTKKNIGILLSGGMDSRMVAGTLDYLIKTKRLTGVHVCALTWGNPDSRDVVYSKRIAQRLKWDWKHYMITPEIIINNINETAKRGCEYSAIHLHALPQISEDNELDCILAGSYGDSVGRAEYSGVKVKHLKNLSENFRNFGSILKNNIYKEYKDTWHEDINFYHNLYPQKKPYQQFEQDYQLHYMRRMLNPCMEVIGDKMPFYQAFTKPSVFGYMWKLKLDKRTDEIYKIMHSRFSTDFSDVPWARTGLPYYSNKGIPDNYKKSHHSYPSLITNDLYPHILNQVLSSNINGIGIFNMDALEALLKLIKILPQYNFDYLEKLMWLTSFSVMLQHYKIGINDEVSPTISDKLTGNLLVPVIYTLKYAYRRFSL